jgi:putative Mn2+ efflux pump MntP
MGEAIALAFGLAMDATAIAAARGLSRQRGEIVILPLLFGLFQSGMAALGWLLGEFGGPYIATFNTYVASGLLFLIGGKMLYDAFKGGDEDDEYTTGIGTYLLLALATSIDAAAAGITLPMLPVSPWLALLLIGAVTLVLSAIGYRLGRAVGKGLEGKLEVLGGLVLIGLGVRVLVQHL